MSLTIQVAEQQLHTILAAVTDALAPAARVALQERLNAFSSALPYHPEFGVLRRAADDTFDDLGRRVAEQTLESIRGRSARLAEQVREINAVTARASADAESVRASTFDRAVAAAGLVADGMAALDTAIRSNDLTSAVGELEATWVAVRTLRETLAGRG